MRNRFEVSTTFLFQNSKNSQKMFAAVAKKRFLAITPKLSILGHMLLHKSYINMAIANILLCRKSRYDLPGLKYKNPWARETLKRAWPRNGCGRPNQNWSQVEFHCLGSKLADSSLKTKSADKANDLYNSFPTRIIVNCDV